MHVPNTARRSVFFLGSVDENGTFRPKATAFFVAVPPQTNANAGWHPYLVTAEHVVVRLANAKQPMFARINMKDGTSQVVPLADPAWWHHPTAEKEPTDVAVASIHLNWDIVDHDCIPMPEKWEANSISLSRRPIGLGDEIFTIGLFRNHAGFHRNIPIVRIGNIAAIPEEPVYTKQGHISAYLAEMRSIGGLSGSPVFADLPSVEIFPPGSFLPDPRFQSDPEQVNWGRYRFVGLIHGHFDIPNLSEDSVVEEDHDSTNGNINTGIGVIVPSEKIMETLYQAEFVENRRELEEHYAKQSGVIPDAS